jgi:hypothetical protein
VSAQHGDTLSIDIERRMGSDPDLIYVFGPKGRLQERLEIYESTSVEVTCSAGPGVYKILPVNYTYIHTYTMPGETPMVVAPFDHQEMLRLTGVRDLYFKVPENTTSMTFHAHSRGSSDTIREELYDPSGAPVHTFVLAPNTYQEDYTEVDPMPGIWRCRFQSTAYDRCGAWLEGVPNYFSPTPETWFEPAFPGARAKLTAHTGALVSTGARVGVNWWLMPQYPSTYGPERDAVVQARMDTARISVDWAWREPQNDNGDPFDINWAGFNFTGIDERLAAYDSDVISAMPDAMPVLLFYWSSSVSWQSGNPAGWTETQREEFAEFVLATMIHIVAPDLEEPPGTTPAYDFIYAELLNEPNLTMGSANYQAYIDIVEAAGRRLQSHPDPRINGIRLVAPGIGWVWGGAGAEMENWIGRLLDQADAYVGGINWHQYEYLRIEECHRYAEDIAGIRGWLETRGDAVADELIFMTETNQHGGPPTYWKRQDTFYASRWWAGACLSALRGGVHFLHYYQLLDDPPGSYNYKGMMFNDGPYDPPLFPGGPPHGEKPVLEAAGLLNTHRLKHVAASDCDHPEIAHLVTRSDDGREITVFLVNLFDRNIHLDLEIYLPRALQEAWYSREMHTLSEKTGGGGAAAPEAGLEGLPVSSSDPAFSVLREKMRLLPRTIYAVKYDFKTHPGLNF